MRRLAPRGDVPQLADAGDAGEFGDERAHGRNDEAGDRDPGPEAAEAFRDQLAMAAAGEYGQADRQLLDDVEDGHQHELQQEEPVAPGHARLPGGDDAADVGIGEHDDEAGAEDGDVAGDAGGGTCGGQGHGVVRY